MQYFFFSNKTSGFECKCVKYGNQWGVVVIYDMVIAVVLVPVLIHQFIVSDGKEVLT
jgi:hypothetical protein